MLNRLQLQLWRGHGALESWPTQCSGRLGTAPLAKGALMAMVPVSKQPSKLDAVGTPGLDWCVGNRSLYPFTPPPEATEAVGGAGHRASWPSERVPCSSSTQTAASDSSCCALLSPLSVSAHARTSVL